MVYCNKNELKTGEKKQKSRLKMRGSKLRQEAEHRTLRVEKIFQSKTGNNQNKGTH